MAATMHAAAANPKAEATKLIAEGRKLIRSGELAAARQKAAAAAQMRVAYGPDADPAERARHWLDAGVSLVVLTRGAHGATAYHRTAGVLHEPGRAVAVVDAVGAGDTFHAALLARLRERGLLRRDALAALDAESVRDLLRYAIAAAAVTCTRRGADLPSADDVRAALA